MDYGSDRMWEDLNPAIIATAVDENLEVHGYEAEPTKKERHWSSELRYYLPYYKLSALALENIPDDWEKSLRLRLPVRGSKAYWDDAPDWAKAAFINRLGDDHWTSNVDVYVRGHDWIDLGGHYIMTSQMYPTDDWKNSKILRPYAWQTPNQDTPVDTPAWRRGCSTDPWEPTNTAGGRDYWGSGRTSHTGDYKLHAHQIVLADQNDLSRCPPLDFELGRKI